MDRLREYELNMLINLYKKHTTPHERAIYLAAKEVEHYRKLKEQGGIIEPPCKVGDTVYFIPAKAEKQGRRIVVTEFIDEAVVDNITLGYTMIPQITVCNKENVWNTFDVDEFGEIVFLTREAAEEALKNGGKPMTRKELNEILEQHRLWLKSNGLRGKSADLCNANLCDANLYDANLCDADLRSADLCNADLRNADLCNANLYNADLRGANIDFSCLPLWCGSLTAHFDDKQLKQIAYHLVKAGLQSKNASTETKKELSKLIDFANGFHRVDECGLIAELPEKEETK